MPRLGGFPRRIVALGAALLATAALAGCAPEPEPGSTVAPWPSASTSASAAPTPSPTGEGSATPTPSPDATATSTPSPTPSAAPTPTRPPTLTISLPSSCEDIYSNTMKSYLGEKIPPLGDPGVTMFSTQLVPGLEILDVAPHLRCTWGTAGGSGLATTVAIVSQPQSSELLTELNAAGYDCEAWAEGERCTIAREVQGRKTGESHVLRGNGWVATSWSGFAPEGYSADIAARLWG